MSKQRRKHVSKQTEAPGGIPAISEGEHHAMIAKCAYHIAEQRGFQGDAALDDWLQAEAQIGARLASKETASG